jgi:hypothetical protein
MSTLVFGFDFVAAALPRFMPLDDFASAVAFVAAAFRRASFSG